MFLLFLVRSSSTEHPSGGDPDPGSVNVDPTIRNRGGLDIYPSSNVPMESMTPTTSKQRREKMTNKAQQDEEEERGIY
jgi:hypothetical protein